MKVIGLIIVAMFIITGTANAIYFYPNYAAWRESGPAEQSGFAAGLVEGLVALGFDDHGKALGTGLTKCVLAMKLDSKMLAEAITEHYKRAPKDWSKPARHVFWEQIVLGACRTHVNDARAARSLEAW